MQKIIHSKKYGHKSGSLIIIHGLLGMGDNWTSLAKKLADNYTVHLIDLRNHGNSFHSEEFDYEALAKDIYDYAFSQDIEKFDLIGHSLGGKTAMKFCNDYPSLVHRLIVADISPKVYKDRHKELFDILLDIDFQKIQSRRDLENELKTKIEDTRVIQFILKNTLRNTDGKYSFKFNLEGIHKNYPNILKNPLNKEKNIPNQTLFIKGELSDYITLPEDSAIIKEYFPNSNITTIENAGHWVQADQPQTFVKICEEFLN